MEFEVIIYDDPDKRNAIGLFVRGHSDPESLKNNWAEWISLMSSGWLLSMKMLFRNYVGAESIMECIIDIEDECFILIKGFPFNFTPKIVDLCMKGTEDFILKYNTNEQDLQTYSLD